MNFIAYIDESDTHGPKPDIVMSAMLATEGQFERLRRGLARVQDAYGFTVFHGSEFKGQKGEFARWSEAKCRGLLKDLGLLVNSHITECFTIALPHATYEQNFLRVRPPKMHRTSQYGFCFDAALDALMRQVRKVGHHHRLSIVVEDGHKNTADLDRIFLARKSQYKKIGVDVLGTLTRGSKAEYPLLMVADMTSYGQAQWLRAQKRGEVSPSVPNQGGADLVAGPGWTVLEVTPEYLAMFILEFQTGREAAKEDWQTRKEAWLNGCKSEKDSTQS